MEGRRQLGEIAVDKAGVVVPCRQLYHHRILGQLLDQNLLLRRGQHREVHVGGVLHLIALCRQRFQQRADASVGVLDVVHRILAVLPDGQTQIKLHLRLRLGVEEVAAGVHGNFIQQVGQADGLAGTLGHTHHLAVTHQLHQLHQHDVQPVFAVQPQRVHGAFQAGHMAVVVCAPDVDDLIEAANGEFVAVIGNIGGEVGVEAVGAAQHVVLQRQLLDVRIGLPGGPEVLCQNLRGLEPQRTVLFVGVALRRQRRHGVGHVAAFVKGGLEEPLVVMNAVALQIRLHLGDVVAQTELGQCVMAGLFVAVQILVALFVVEQLGQLPDIVAVVAILGEFHRVLALDDLEVAGLQTLGKLLDLVAGVVDVELAPHVRAGLLKHAGQRIAQHAAPGVAHVHGAGGVGGDELHHDLAALQHVAASVVLARRLNGGNGIVEPLIAQTEVHKAGACDLHGGEVAALQRHMLRQNRRHLTGVHLHSLGRRQTERGGVVAVGHVLGDLHRRLDGHALRQEVFLYSGGVSLLCQLLYLFLGLLDHIHSVSLSLVFVNIHFQHLRHRFT